ncbi:MAG: DNA-processing protein DprA [Actinomycetota bacterium]
MRSERAREAEPTDDAGDEAETVPENYPDGFAATAADRRALLVLSSLRALTARRLLALSARERTASACLAAIRRGAAGSESDRAFARRLAPEDISAALEACGARPVAFDEAEYPRRLDGLKDPPAMLFVRGIDLREVDPAVAMVGARNCSPTGAEIARDIASGLAREGWWIVSGAARGIDAASHEGALEHDRTVAVLGCGIDVTYPVAKRTLLGRVERGGALVSEYPPGVPAEPFRFPARNRIVAGMAEALVVVEGAAGSGSLISADHAVDLGRHVFAVPGPVTSPLTHAPHELIREGAGLIRGPDDLLKDLGVSASTSSRAALRATSGLTPDEARALEVLVASMLPEVVAGEMGLPLPEAVALLTTLEIKGLVRNVGGRVEPVHVRARS